jgi:ABC-type transport system substrate-binding protein
LRILKWFFIISFTLSLILTFNPSLTPKAAANKEKWENQGLDWYYDNLNDDDRRKIRQAMDYAIPRQFIIDELHQGLAVPLATEIAQNSMGYNDSIQPRKFNLTMAKNLMTEVFGKTYNKDADANNPMETKIPYFSMKLVAPTTCAARSQWAFPITINFQAIGIDAELEWWNWNVIMPRIYLDPKGIGYNYDHEGVDAWFVGMNANPDPDYSSQYFTSGFPPAGDNAFWLENQEVTDIINRSLTKPDLNERLAALSDYQHWFFEEVPKSIIRQRLDVFAVDEDLEGFDTYLIGRGWCFNNYTISNQTSMTYTVPGEFVDLIPILSNSYYDFVPMSNVFGALSQRRSAFNLTHPVPQIAESWSSNEDGTIWEVKLRDGISWSDGSDLTAVDVLFTYYSIFKDEIKSPLKGFFLRHFPNNESDIYLKAGTTDTIIFELSSFFPYVESQILTLPILQKKQFENISFDKWKTHDLNTGVGEVYLLGCGPYMITGINGSGPYDTTGVNLEINPYFDQGIFGHNPTASGGGIFFTNPTLNEIQVVVVKDISTAIDGLASGIYDILDSQTGIQAQYANLNSPDNDYNSKCINALEYGWQELSYNHYDPRWGMNAHDPREMYPDEYTNNVDLPLLDPLGLGLALVSLIIIKLPKRRKLNK